MSVIQKLSAFLCLLLCVISLQGVWDFGHYDLIIFALWAVFTLIGYYPEIYKTIKDGRLLVLFIFIFFYFFSSSLSESISTSFNRCVAFLYVASPVIMYEVYRKNSKSFKLSFILVLSIIYFINIGLSFVFINSIGEYNMRQSAEIYGEEYHIVFLIFNICYSFSLILPSLVDIMRKQGRRLNILVTVLLLAVIVSMTFYLIRAQFMTAVLLAVTGSLIAFFQNKKFKLLPVAIVLFIFVFSFLMIYPIVKDTWSSNSDYNDAVARLDEVYATITGEKGKSDDFDSRRELTITSLKTFVKNPLFGVNHKINSRVHVEQQGLGNHASWPDFLARYGAFAFLIFWFLLKSLRLQRARIKAYIPSLMIILLGFFNPLWFFPQMITTFLLIPFTYDVLIPELKFNQNENIINK